MLISHEASEDLETVAHQAVSSEGWDEELVPDQRGRSRRPDPSCPVEVALLAISGRWTTLVLRSLMHGDRSYTVLKQDLPTLSDKVLTDILARLRERGLVHRKIVRGFPSRALYGLTPAGHGLRPLLVQLYRTGISLQQ